MTTQLSKDDGNGKIDQRRPSDRGELNKEFLAKELVTGGYYFSISLLLSVPSAGL